MSQQRHISFGLVFHNHQPVGQSDEVFETIYRDPNGLRAFMSAMDALLTPVVLAAGDQIDFTRYNHVLDIGGAWGTLPHKRQKNRGRQVCL